MYSHSNHMQSKSLLRIGVSVGTAVFLFLALFAALHASVLAAPDSPQAPLSNALRISQVYGGGGNSGATYTHDFIELFNSGPSTINLAGWSVQYASAAGTTWAATALSGSIAPGQYYLIQEAQGAGGTTPLPTPDAIGTLAMSGTNGKVALVNSTTSLSGTCPLGSTVIDFVGYGTANCFEGSAATPALSNTTAAIRNDSGCTDSDSNSADFTISAPTPRNTSSPTHSCSAAADLSISKSVTPATNVPHLSTITYTVALQNSGAVSETAVLFTDTLPISTTFGTWINQPAGAVHAAGVITWTGTVTNGKTITFTFTANQTANYGATITNTAAFSGTITGAAQAAFTVEAGNVCLLNPSHRIHEIQGSGTASPLVGSSVTVQAVVVADFQTTLNGFFIQEKDINQDADPATSEGLFVFNSAAPVSAGDLVHVAGTVAEFSGLTELTSATVNVCSQGNIITPTLVTLPLASGATFEPYEGMSIKMEDLTATDNFRLGRFGQVRLATHRLAQPTNVVLPGAPAVALQALNNLSYITLDDARTIQNADPMIYPAPELTYTNTLRGGDSVAQVIGVIDHYNADSADDYRLQPTQPVSFTAVNVRQERPDVGGTIQVASFNVLNYFTTLGTSAICGPSSNLGCRGANDAIEFERQYTKIVNAIVEIDAAVVGLMEIENNVDDDAVIDLVTRINLVAGAGVYDYVDTGTIGSDAIKVALIYQPALVTPIGAYTLLDSSVDPLFDDTRNRPTLIQTFEENSSGERFTVAVNHLKSKGSACSGDPDLGDGQGNCNVTRTNAAEALVDYLATDPTASSSDRFLIIGDMNSYAKEDPIRTIEAASYTNLISSFGGANAYGYQFDGQWGYLDHGLASNALVPFVTDAIEWHLNSDEPTVFDYNTEFKSANQIIIFYSPEPFRSSDHDPVIVGLDLTPVVTPTIDILTPTDGQVFTSTNGTAVSVPVTITTTNFTIPTDGHWHLWLDGVNTGAVMGYTATVSIEPGTHVITADLNSLSHVSLGISDSVTVTVTELPTIEILSPTAGEVFTSTNGTAVSVPVTITTTNFAIPTDGHWHLWLDGVNTGAVMGYTTTVSVEPGTHVITADLNSLSHVSLGVSDSVTVTVNVEYFLYLPAIMKP